MFLEAFDSARDVEDAVAHARENSATQVVAPGGDESILLGAGFAVCSDWWVGTPGEPGSGEVRTAQESDLDQLVAWGAQRRAAYAPILPVFWNPAPDAEERHRPYLAHLIESDHAVVLVAPDGFIVAEMLRSGERRIDDFVVSGPSHWDTTGRELLRHVGGELTVIGARHDEPKRAMLEGERFQPQRSWYTLALAEPPSA